MSEVISKNNMSAVSELLYRDKIDGVDIVGDFLSDLWFTGNLYLRNLESRRCGCFLPSFTGQSFHPSPVYKGMLTPVALHLNLKPVVRIKWGKPSASTC